MYPQLSKNIFYRKLFYNFFIGFIIILISLTIGICGYMYFAKLKFIDALQNASMILGGMGPVDQMPTNSAKCFASLYSLFSGIILISTVVILFSPIVHRIMHKFHLETDNDKL